MKTVFSLFSILIMIGMTGCATTNLQTQAKMTRAITLMPDQLNEKKVYLRVSGTEASKIELEEPLKKALIERGVLLTSSEEANFYLHINTLFADNLKEAANLNTALLGGAAAGAIATVNNSGGNSILIGVGVALAMGVADRALADETYRAVINVALSEKNKSNPTTTEWNRPQETRLLIEAVRMNLNLEEAKPIMEQKASYQIAEIFK